jgi:serine/threonine protein kinase
MESDIRSDWLDSAQPFSTTTRSVPFLPSTSSMIIYDGQYKTKATTGEPSVFNLLAHTMRARKSIRLLDILGFSGRGVARLGEGATYVVEKKQPVEGKGFVAVKTAKFTVPRGVTQLVALSSHELRRLKSVLLEVEILAHPPLQAHPNIAKLLGDSPGFTPQLVMELATFGSLKTFLEQNSVSEITKKELCHDIACGLDALHQCMIVHGDVKQDNVLVFPHPTRTFTARVSDFEHAVLEANTSHYLGTPIYNAPEVHGLMRENVRVQQSLSLTQLFLCDAFAFGLLVFEIFLNGRRYFELEGGDLLQNRISDNIEGTSKSTEKDVPYADNERNRNGYT